MASKIPKDYTYNGLTYKEWVEEGRALVVKQGNLTGWSNKYWVRPDGTQVELYSQKRPSTPQSVLEKGGHYDVRKTSVRENFKKTRKVNEGAWREALRKSVQKMGLGDRYEEFVKEIETGLRQWKKDIAAWNRKLPGGADDPLAVTRGHIKALANGGMDLPENIIREFKYAVDGVRGNLSRIASEDSPLIARMMAGAPDNTDEWVIKRMLAESEGGDITRNQSHELREAILAAGDDTELIDDLIAKADIETRPIKPNSTLRIGKQMLKGAGLAALPSAFDLITPNSASSATEKLMGGKQDTSWGTIGGEFLEEAKNNYVQGLPFAAGAGLISAAGGGAALTAAAWPSLLIGGVDATLALSVAIGTGFTRGAELDNSIPSGRIYNPDRTWQGETFLQKPEIQVINQQHRDFAREMEAKTSQTAATKLGNAVEKVLTNPLNEVKYVYNSLSDWLQNLGKIE